MGLSTIDIAIPGAGGSNNGGGAYKGIVPGNHKVKINKFELWTEHWKRDNGLFLVMKMETTKPSPDFEGYPIDDSNPDGPKHEGLVGNVHFSFYAYKDGFNTTRNTEISRDKSILEDILRLCVELDCVQWFKDAHGKYDTIEEWVDAFNNDAPYKDKYLEVCISGEQYMSKEGKLKTKLCFSKYEKEGNTYINAYKGLTSPKKIVEYNEAKHFKKVNPEPVDKFEKEGAATETVDVDTEVEIPEMPFDVDEGFDI